MPSYATHFSTRATPQVEPIPGKPMVPNSAGGFGFQVDDWTRLNRFLILGSEGGTYYATERKLTIENAQCVIRCLDADPLRAVQAIVEISDSGRAPKNDPAIFALAIAAGHKNPIARRAAEAAIPEVCRIGTHLHQFMEAVHKFRGCGKGLRKAADAWYNGKAPDALAYDLVKYQQRDGWAHRDTLRLMHVHSTDPARNAAFRWAVGGAAAIVPSREVKRGERTSTYALDPAALPAIITAFEEAKTCDRPRLIKLILDDNLPREAVPTEALNDPDVWAALLVKMPLTAMVRNLGKMTAIGLLKPTSAAAKTVADRLGDQGFIQKSRLHPMAIILAAKTYGQGHSSIMQRENVVAHMARHPGEHKKVSSWSPVSQVNDSLDAAFYLAFKNVEPTGKRTLMGLDVSGSMSQAVAGSSLSCAEAAAVMAMVQMKVEPHYQLMAFDTGMRPLDISKYSRLTDVVRNTSNINGGGTDCSLPMLLSLQNGWDVDSFQVYTDNETWFGGIHPCQALTRYRQQRGIPAKLAVQAFTATSFSIADPSDAGMMDFCGLDAASPSVMADFFRG